MSLPAAEAARVGRANLAVLCVDTCSLLDIVRDPYRDAAQPHNAVAAMALLLAMESGSSLVCLVADQVRQELAIHRQAVIDDAEHGLGRLREHVERVDGIVSAFASPGQTDLAHWGTHLANTTAALQRWIGAATSLPQSSDVPMRAYSRALQARAPARKGKDSLADCVVLETYLEAGTDLRSRGLTAPIVFLSSNTQDYAEPPGRSVLRHELQAEFDAINMQYASGHGVARVLLGLTGSVHRERPQSNARLT